MADLRDDWRRCVCADRRLGERALRVAVALLNYANAAGRTTVGIMRLSLDTGIDARHVRRELGEFVRLKYARRTPGAGKTANGGTTTRTQLTLPWLSDQGDEVGPLVDQPPGAELLSPPGPHSTQEGADRSPPNHLNQLEPGAARPPAEAGAPAPHFVVNAGACARESEGDRGALAPAPEREGQMPRARAMARMLLSIGRKSDAHAAKSTGLSLEAIAELRRELTKESDVSDHPEEPTP